MNLVWNTQAIIFDLRTYPKLTGWGLSRYFVSKPTVTNLDWKMQVSYKTMLFGGNDLSENNQLIIYPRSDKKIYKGKIVVLCNELSLSLSEFTTVLFQGAGKATTIGSQTMGADGDIATIYFPGGYRSNFSALGVRYPDGTETQRVGVKIDIECKPTLKGLQAGCDEVLERAIRFINTGK